MLLQHCHAILHDVNGRRRSSGEQRRRQASISGSAVLAAAVAAVVAVSLRGMGVQVLSIPEVGHGQLDAGAVHRHQEAEEVAGTRDPELAATEESLVLVANITSQHGEFYVRRSEKHAPNLVRPAGCVARLANRTTIDKIRRDDKQCDPVMLVLSSWVFSLCQTRSSARAAHSRNSVMLRPRIRTDDKAALRAAFSFDPAPLAWHSILNWTAEEPCDPAGWTGIRCTDGRVTRVDFHLIDGKEALVFQMLSPIGLLRELDYLSTSGCTAMYGTIPDGLMKSPKLSRLYLHSIPRLSGTVPSTISALNQSLEIMSLYDTALSGTMPANLDEMLVLRGIFLSGVTVSGTIPALPANLNSLQLQSPLSGSLPRDIGLLQDLSRLMITGTRLSGTLPITIGRWTNLEYMFVFNSFISGSLPSTIGKMSSLRILDLHNSRLVELANELWQCERLEVLDASHNLLRNLPLQLPRSLTHVYLDQNPLNLTTERVSAALGSAPSVVSFAIAGTTVPITLAWHEFSPPQCSSIAWRGTGCAGTRVIRPAGCRVGPSAPPCTFTLQMYDADEQPAVTGGLVEHLTLRYGNRSSDMIDNRDGTFSAIIPTQWIASKGTYVFQFFQEDEEFTPFLTIGNAYGTDPDCRAPTYGPCASVRTVFFAARQCPKFAVVDESGTRCSCAPGFHESENFSQAVPTCLKSCETGTRQSPEDPSRCDCDGGTYDPSISGRVSCVLGDWPPPPVDDDTGVARCLACPNECADCQAGAIWAKTGWRLNGSVGKTDLSDQLFLQPILQAHWLSQVLYMCPRGTLCPAFPLSHAMGDSSFDSSCPLGRVGPLCQSCGANRLADDHTGTCIDCPAFGIKNISGCSVVAITAVSCLIGLLFLVSWTRDDMKSVQAGVEALRSTVAKLSSVTESLNQPLNDQGQHELCDIPDSGNHSPSLTREPSVGLPEIFDQLDRLDKNSATALRTVSLQLAFQSTRILISYAQVVTQLGTVLHVQLPPLFVKWLHNLQLLTVDISAFLSSCMMPCLSAYQQWNVYVLVVPAVMGVIVALLFIVERYRHVADVSDRFKTRAYFVLFLIYPTVCRRSFSLFNCRSLGEHLSVLIDDYNIACYGEQHSRYQLGAGVVILVFIVGVPIFLFLLLSRTLGSQHKLTPEDQYIVSNLVLQGKEVLGQFSADTANDILRMTYTGYAPLTSVFKTRFYYWESLDMVRKLLLVGMLVFAGQGSTAQCCLAVALSFGFFAAQIGYWPCKLDADNQLRASCEAHIFLTCVVALALKTRLEIEKFRTADYGALLIITLVGLGLHACYCIAAKIRETRRLLAPQVDEDNDGVDQRRLSAFGNALKLHNLGFGDTENILFRHVQKLREQYNDFKVAEQLSDDDQRTLSWIKEDLQLQSNSDAAAIQDACHAANIAYEADDAPTVIVRAIANALVERVQREQQDGVFLSHYQALAGPDVMELKGQLERDHPSLAQIWYDKDENPSIEGMRLGVRKNRFFVAYLTQDYFLRPFCRKEIRWALAYKKEIILLWKREGGGAVSRFRDFFDDCRVSVHIMGEDDGGGQDLTAIFDSAAINYYTDGPFHCASMAEIARRFGITVATPRPRTKFLIPEPIPGLLLAFSQDDANAQVQSIVRELERMAPGLTGQSSRLGSMQRRPGPDTIVLVYLTESVWTSADTSVLDAVIRALQASAKVVFVAETDMAHGWSQLQAERSISDWSDAVRHLKNNQTPASYFEAHGGVSSAMFDDVIPFYKDRAFREVSIQCILERLGATQSESK